MPPSEDNMKTLKKEGGSPKKYKAGIVKITPVAIASPTDATVWTILFSKIVDFLKHLNKAIDMIAAGIDADTVIPTLSPR